MDLVEFARRRSRPVAPVDSGIEPKLPHLENVRAVLFDLYGTLLVSDPGNGDPAGDSEISTGAESPIPPRREIEELVAGHHELGRAAGKIQPEIEIRAIWEEWFSGKGYPVPGRVELEGAIVADQCASCPCGEMPGASETIRALATAGLALGVISNAQFYTEILVEAILGFPLDGPEFERDLVFLSWREGEGKPSPVMHRRAARALAERGIAPAETLYVGNDWGKDVVPSREVGFHAAWFAGDARSLVAGEEGVEACRKKADVVLTNLGQLREVVGLGEA